LIANDFKVKFKLELLKSLLLPDFPSGSSINFHGGKFYLIGDDARTILMLDEKYQDIGSLHLFDNPDKRIPKPKKPDFETSVVMRMEGKDYLLVLGSASLEKRVKLILVPLDQAGEKLETFQYEEFASRVRATGISELNIEGCTLIGNRLVLSNRGNEAHPKNHLITTTKDFWQQQQRVVITVSEVALSVSGTSFLGISELCYAESRDLLLLTCTSEMTSNAYDDGLIGDSCLGWIEGFAHKINTPQLKLDGMINLVDLSEEFKGEKIEGICIETVESDGFIVHLISDNDQGQSKLFKIKIVIA
jgi:hypothetical protein